MAYRQQGRAPIDDRLKISLSKLGIADFMPGIHSYMTLGQLYIEIYRYGNSGMLTLKYKSEGEDIKYNVNLISRPSNLPNGGIVWFMICPFTGNLCRKLYYNGKHFVHRKMIKGIYESQTLSRNQRSFRKMCDNVLNTKGFYENLFKKNAKKQYRGIVTKRHAKLLQQLALIRNHNTNDSMDLFFSCR